MNRVLLLVTLALSVACSGKDIVPPLDEPVAGANIFDVYDDTRNDEQLVVVDNGLVIPDNGEELTIQLFKKGIMGLSVGSREMYLNDWEDFDFWHRFATTEYHEDPVGLIESNDVILIMNWRSRWKYEFVMERIYLVDGELNIYYSYRANHDADDYGIVDYEFYLIDRKVDSYNFIEVE